MIDIIKLSILSIALLLSLLVQSAHSNIVTDTIAYESRGECFEGQVMVASVIKTRMKERGQTSEEVVTAPYQFSCNNKDAHLKPNTKLELLSARLAWEQAEAGEYNHYCHYTVKPYWVKHATKKKQIENHIFYKL